MGPLAGAFSLRRQRLLQTAKRQNSYRRNDQIHDQTERKLTSTTVAFVAVRLLCCCVGQFERAEVEQKAAAGRGREAWLKPPVQGSSSRNMFLKHSETLFRQHSGRCRPVWEPRSAGFAVELSCSRGFGFQSRFEVPEVPKVPRQGSNCLGRKG